MDPNQERKPEEVQTEPAPAESEANDNPRDGNETTRGNESEAERAGATDRPE